MEKIIHTNNMKTSDLKNLTKSKLIGLLIKQNLEMKKLEQRVENLNKNSLKNLSTNYLEDAKKLGYTWKDLLRKATRETVINKVIENV